MRPLLLLMPLLLVGCSGSDETTAPTPTPSASPSATVTLDPTPTPEPTPSASATPPPTSSATPAPAADGDVDGDGKQDRVHATAATLTVELSGGGTVTADVHTDSPRAPQVLGSHDVDRDGHAEVFLLTASGSSTQFATPYRFDGRRLHELQLGDEPARLGIGGSVTHGDGFRCARGLLEVHRAESTDGSTYRVTTTAYRLTTTALSRVRTTTSTARQGSTAVEAAYTVECGSVTDGS